MMILKKSETSKAKRSVIWLIQHAPMRPNPPICTPKRGSLVTDSRGRQYKVAPAGNLKRV